MEDSAFAARLAESQAGIERELEILLSVEPKPGEPARPKRPRRLHGEEGSEPLATAERRVAHRLDEPPGPS